MSALRNPRPLACALALAVLTSALVGCGPPWKVLKASGPPSTLKGVTAVTVAYDEGSLLVGGVFASSAVADYRKKLDAEQTAKFDEVMATANKSFFQAFSAGVAGIGATEAAGPAKEGEVRVTVKHTFLQQGKYAVMAAVPSSTIAQLVWSVGGDVVDVIEVRANAPATITTPAILQRIGTCGSYMGKLGARFLNDAQAAPK